MTERIYTGVGSRKTPLNILQLISNIAQWLFERNWILRSGGAGGADSAFADVVPPSHKNVFRPHHARARPRAYEIAAQFHPAWEGMKDYAKDLHARNSFQVLGADLNNPSKMLICWTPDGCIRHEDRTISTGGTGTAISIADAFNVPILNLKRKEHRDRILAKIGRN